MSFSSTDIINILKSPVTPYPYTFLFFYQEEKFPIYPRCEVVRTQSDSDTTETTKLSKDVTYEIRLYTKYTRLPQIEETDRENIEKIITDTLEAYDFLPTQKIYFESKQWSHRVIDEDVRGSVSTLRFKYTEISSTTGSGIVGSTTTWEVNSQATPTVIKVLNFTFDGGVDIAEHNQDDGTIQYDPVRNDTGTITITYENTTTIDSLVKSLTDAMTENNGRFIHGGISTNYTFLFGATVKSNSYGDIERATTTIHLQGTWA